MSAAAPIASIVVPVHDGAAVLHRSLGALVASDLERHAWELIVVDDASRDDSALIAAQYADTVVKLTGSRPRGPAYARNRGMELARAEIIVCVDADVCVHPDALRRLTMHLIDDATLGAVVGAFDVGETSPGLVTTYRNLRVSFLQQRAAGDVDYFWAACGAVRRSVLDAVGCFDEWHYWRPQAEGAELGQRVRAAGFRIVLDPTIEATHLKRWTLASSVATDLQNHGVPWMRLLLQGRNLGRTRAPSLSAREKFTAAMACMWAAFALLNIAAPLPRSGWLLLAGGVATLSGAAPFFWFAARKRSPGVALLCIPLQLLHYVTSGLSVVCAFSLHQMIGEPKRHVTDDAFAEVGFQTWPPVPRRLASDAWKQPAEKVS